MIRPIAHSALAVALLPLLGCSGEVPPDGAVARGEDVASRSKPDAGGAAPGPAVQGLAGDERARMFHLSTGSEMVPLAWLKALTNVRTGKPFLDDLGRYGFLPDPDGPDGLPVGLAIADSKAFPGIGEMVGANCAACHVGEIARGGRSLVILGAPNLLDFNNFVVDLNASARAALEPAALAKFVAKMAANGNVAHAEKVQRLAPALAAILEADDAELGASEAAIKSALTKSVADAQGDLRDLREGGVARVRDLFEGRLKADADRLAARIDPKAVATKAGMDMATIKADLDGGFEELIAQAKMLKSLIVYHEKLTAIHEQMTPEPGPGRIDAFGAIRDAVLGKEDFIPPTSPVSYPHLWMGNRTSWFHWDGNTNSMMQRDVGQTLGLGAIFDPETFASTVLPRNLATLERLVWKIQTPRWPEDLLGPIVSERAERGKVLYARHCLSCHAMAGPDDTIEPPPPFPPVEPVQFTKLEEIGTDPERVKGYAIHVGRNPDGTGGTPFANRLRLVAYKFTEAAYAANAVPLDDQKAWDRPESEVSWTINDGYANRPLAGIWATAPYLHNGSVPTLYDLLLPGDRRPATFYVGYREYDPAKLGFVSEKENIPAAMIDPKGVLPFVTTLNRVFPFDTTLKGNLRTGHEYGTRISEEQRKDLLEYLKTL